MCSLTQPKLPVLDFSTKNLNSTTSNSWATMCGDVTRALEEYGCFVATYDGVSRELHDAIFRASKDLFDLPTKVKVQLTSTTPFHGYVGQVPMVPLYEALCIENATTPQGAERFTKLMWPDGNQSFCETTMMFSKAVAELDHMVMKMVAESYGIEENYKLLRGSTAYLLRLIKYLHPQDNERNWGVIPHTDKSFMSILHQKEVKGLEVKTKDGNWIEVDPSPSSFVVMAGDAFMAWTNGRIESPSHRVMMQGKEDRYSLAFRTFIRDRMIEVPRELVDEDHPLRFEAFDNYKYIHYYHTDEGSRSKCPIKSYCGI